MDQRDRGIGGYLGVKKCVADALSDVLSSVFDASREFVEKLFSEQKVKIGKTPSPDMGDLGVPLHYLFIMNRIDRREWSRYGEEIVSRITSQKYRDECFIQKAVFMNGYLNIWIDYTRLLDGIVDEILGGKLDEKLKGIGRGRRVVVEHTSANPVHPLHVGSGRNSVIGSTYASLLRRLGYDVDERFYVDDMGRQVSIMIYGYSLLRRRNIEPRRDVKIDHWFGAVYALTNILIEKNKLIKKLGELDHSLTLELGRILGELKEKKWKDPLVYNIIASIENMYGKKKYIHRYDEELTRIWKRFEKILRKLGEKEDYREIIDALKTLRKYIDEYNEVIEELKQFSESEFRLGSFFPEIYGVLREEIKDPAKAEEMIDELMRRYEFGDSNIKSLFREASTMVLEGFRETLKKINIVFDGYDWESDEKILEYTRHILDEVVKLPYTIVEGKAVIVDLDKAAKEHQYIREIFGGEEPGRVVLRRSDGTTLYVTRDIAYAIYKFKDLGAVKAYNVIAHEQEREQKQVRAILYLLGYREIAENLVHFQYEMVHLKGRSMSGRRGVYYTMDELLDDYTSTVISEYIENTLRKAGEVEIDYESIRENAAKLAVSNTRILLASIDPRKVLVFNPDKLGEHLHGSWITYTFVRLQGILRRYLGFEPLDKPDDLRERILSEYTSLKKHGVDIVLNIEEKLILDKLSEYLETLLYAAEYMEVNRLVEYLNDLSSILNRFYEKYSVLGEKDPVKRTIRAVLVALSLLVMNDLFNILKLPVIKKL